MDILPLHWIRPGWLWLIPLVWLAAVFAWRQHQAGGDWARIADPHLLKFLGGGESHKSRNLLAGLVTAGLSLGLVALAGPAWEQSASGSFSANQARVVVLDLSRSMLAQDIKPNRVAHARFKLMDLLDKVEEGQVGLVAYAGQAFVIAPLSSDMETIKNMVPALNPDIMPAPGSRPDEALTLAAELINQAGFANGEILLITDSSDSRTVDRAKALADLGFTISVLAIGTTQGAPIPSGRGFIKDREGKIVVARLNQNKLRAVARAGGGDYLITHADNSELTELLGGGSEDFIASDDNDHTGLEQRWLDQGYWLLLLLLPIVLLSFRKGWLFVLPILLLPYSTQPLQAQAIGESPPAVSFTEAGEPPTDVALAELNAEAGSLGKTWGKLWRNADQRAQRALQQQSFQQALDVAPSPRFQAEALYRQTDYSQAMELWKSMESKAGSAKQKSDAAYNLGNALAAQNELDDAIAAYDRALVLDPENADAQANRDVLKNLQDQQNQDGEENQEEGEEGENQEDQQSQEDQQNQDSEDSQDSEESEDENDDADAAENEEEQQTEQEQTEEEEAADEQPAEMTQEEQWTEEDEQAKEQWLRRIPDDPGGLLRRKLIQEYKRRGRQDPQSQAW